MIKDYSNSKKSILKEKSLNLKLDRRFMVSGVYYKKDEVCWRTINFFASYENEAKLYIKNKTDDYYAHLQLKEFSPTGELVRLLDLIKNQWVEYPRIGGKFDVYKPIKVGN